MKSGPHFRHVATSEKGDEEGLAFRGQKPFLSTGDGSFHARAALPMDVSVMAGVPPRAAAVSPACSGKGAGVPEGRTLRVTEF